MSNTLTFEIGDIIVRYGRILKTFKVQKNTIFFKPYFASKNIHGDLIYSLPLENITMTNIRKIVSIQKLNNLFKLILRKPGKYDENTGPVFDRKTSLENNDLEETMKIIKTLWLEKEVGGLPDSKLVMFRQAMHQAVEEVAAVRGLTPEKAETQIMAALQVKKQKN